MDMNVNIYLPDDFGERVKKADLEVSRICQAALAKELEDWETKEAAKVEGPFGRIEVKVGDGERPTITKAFSGRWLVREYVSEEEDAGPVRWSVALTKGGNFAVYSDYNEGDRRALQVFGSLEEAYDDVPEDVLAAAASRMGVVSVIELDI